MKQLIDKITKQESLVADIEDRYRRACKNPNYRDVARKLRPILEDERTKLANLKYA